MRTKLSRLQTWHKVESQLTVVKSYWNRTACVESMWSQCGENVGVKCCNATCPVWNANAVKQESIHMRPTCTRRSKPHETANPKSGKKKRQGIFHWGVTGVSTTKSVSFWYSSSVLSCSSYNHLNRTSLLDTRTCKFYEFCRGTLCDCFLWTVVETNHFNLGASPDARVCRINRRWSEAVCFCHFPSTNKAELGAGRVWP